MERHGDGPKPGPTALAKPRKTKNASKAPASASSVRPLQGMQEAPLSAAAGFSARRFQQPPAHVRRIFLGVLPECRRWGGEAFFPRTVARTARCAKPGRDPHPAPGPSASQPLTAPVRRRRGPGTHLRAPGRMRRRRERGGGSVISCSHSLSAPRRLALLPHLPSSALYCSA